MADRTDHNPAQSHDERMSGHEADLISASLGGTLPCVTCGYDLQGLSILTVCPECGSAVRATILAVVDPLADELRPISHPRAVAAGLILWSGAALLAATVGWYAWTSYLLYGWQGEAVIPLPWNSWPLCVGGSILLSGLGALGLLWPHDGLGPKHFAMALGSIACYPPLAVAAYTMARGTQAATRTGLLEAWTPWPDRPLMRLAAAALVIAVIAGLRPNARALVARSLALRTGRVDRQTMLAMAAAAAVAALGDALGMLGVILGPPAVDALRTTGLVLILAGALLLTLGLVGSTIDSVRIAASVLAPGPSLRQVIAPRRRGRENREETPTSGGGQ